MSPEFREFLLTQYRLYKGFCSSLRRQLGLEKTCPHCGKPIDE